jgi:hypothetical protein
VIYDKAPAARFPVHEDRRSGGPLLNSVPGVSAQSLIYRRTFNEPAANRALATPQRI